MRFATRNSQNGLQKMRRTSLLLQFGQSEVQSTSLAFQCYTFKRNLSLNFTEIPLKLISLGQTQPFFKVVFTTKVKVLSGLFPSAGNRWETTTFAVATDFNERHAFFFYRKFKNCSSALKMSLLEMSQRKIIHSP